MWKRIFKIKRYFLVSYSFEKGQGRSLITTYDGKYFNLLDFEESQAKTPVGKIAVNNIIEIGKLDYKDLLK